METHAGAISLGKFRADMTGILLNPLTAGRLFRKGTNEYMR